jgi:hypothetical protein
VRRCGHSRLARGLLFGGLLLLAACAQPAPAPEVAPLPYPPSVRARIQHFALGEWRDWGGVTLDATTRPPSTNAEAAIENFPRVLAYWRAVPQGRRAIAENRPLYAAALAGDPDGAELWREPAWSAAFISWVMAAAGVDAREFPPSASHSAYVDALIRDAERFPGTAPFMPLHPRAGAPAVGDLLCADRSGAPLADWRARAADAGRFRPMHCDIVVATGPSHVDVIGGNVLDAVTRTRFPTDAAGILLPERPGAPVWFALFRNRLGRLPPWSNTP